jgi:hypothetical protein
MSSISPHEEDVEIAGNVFNLPDIQAVTASYLLP